MRTRSIFKLSIVQGSIFQRAIVRGFPGQLLGIPLGALLIAALYLPTLSTPFDFVDDGNLVYPAPPGTTLTEHVARWWDRVVANYEHLGPVRPVLWAHWELLANLTGGDPHLWRVSRWVWCWLAAMMLLILMHELNIHPWAALLATAFAMWNPYRNEIWTSLTLGEGVAMPYALLALIAARRAARSPAPGWWDGIGVLCVIAALGCKNTFLALVPAQVVLRLAPDHLSWQQSWRQNRVRALALAGTLILPVAHLIYFKIHWHPGQYVTHGPSVAQVLRQLHSLKGGFSTEYLAAGLVLLGIAWFRTRPPQYRLPDHRAALAAAVLVIGAWFLVYLPLDMMSGRYTMPGIWVLDILFGVLLTRCWCLPRSRWRQLAGTALVLGLIGLAIANVARQQKFAARARLLWDVVHHLEETAPPHATVLWVAGDSTRGELNVEEGIHVRWHLLHRGRPDIQFRLCDRQEQPIERVELPRPILSPDEHVDFRIWGPPSGANGWPVQAAFRQVYHFGRKQTECCIGQRVR